jgi:hypothetical protein
MMRGPRSMSTYTIHTDLATLDPVEEYDKLRKGLRRQTTVLRRVSKLCKYPVGSFSARR